MLKFESTKTSSVTTRTSPILLETIGRLDDVNESGVAVSSYGRGRVSGAMFTVPAHGQVEVDFRIRLLCITPEDVQNLTNLIMSLLDASRQHMFRELSKTEVSGGASFFGFFAWGGARASYSNTKEVMNSFGLSEENQRTIVKAMMDVVQKPSEFNYRGTIYNRDNDYDVTGNLFAIVMDAEIRQDSVQRQFRALAPKVHLGASDGRNLPAVGDLYGLTN
jgi:hypothetical protein